MIAFIVAPQAEEDIFHIRLYLLREVGMEIADRVEGEILAAFPGLGGSSGEETPPPRPQIILR
jgi:plasmid stabilization system protein ParE